MSTHALVCPGGPAPSLDARLSRHRERALPAQLCCCCLLVGSIVRRFASTWRPALLGAFFCLAIFAVAADYPAYVGVDDPQMLAFFFFLYGFFAYLRWGQSRIGLALSALLFVLAVSIKRMFTSRT